MPWGKDRSAPQRDTSRPDSALGTNLSQSSQHSGEYGTLSGELETDVDRLKEIFEDSFDLVLHAFTVGRVRAFLIYIDGLSNVQELNEHILRPAALVAEQDNVPLHRLITAAPARIVENMDDIVGTITNGGAAVLAEGEPVAVTVGLAKWEKRAVTEPEAEAIVRGPREGFVETLQVNASLLRRKLKTPRLRMKMLQLGRYSQTHVAVAYVDGIVESALVEEVIARLEKIDYEGIMESGNIEEFIEDNGYSPFPQLRSTERPDVAALNLLEGRVVILTEGTPIALIAPVTFFSFLQSPEDYYQRYYIGTAIRWLRYLFLLIALCGPSFYVAVLTYHQEMIPTTLLLTMATSREQIPFPALVEALIMEITFEALREAGVRLPKQVGAAVSIVGALVIGQAAIAAGIVSSPMVMVVAITGIASFMIPQYNFGITLRLLRFPIMLLAGFLGFYGLMLGLILIMIHLLSLRSFGVPYFSVVASSTGKELKDVLFRSPIWLQNERPHFTGRWNRFKQQTARPTKSKQER